jgi:pimeloyl-ACP methyl ester carboxylesterase
MDDDIEVAGPSGPIGAIDWGGSGDPLLLVHGGGTNAAEWAPVVPHLGDHRCVAFDVPGHGRSAEPETPGFDLWLPTMDAVIEHFDLPRGRLAVVGGSFGGALAVWYAGNRPGLRAVIGVDSAPWAAHVATPPLQREPRSAEQFRADGWGWSGDEEGYEAQVAEMIAQGYPEQCARRSHIRRPDGSYQGVPTAEFCAASHAVGSRPDNPLADPGMYARLDCPTLLLCGNDGNAADNREYVDSMPDRFPMVSVSWMDGPHDLDWDQPELVAEHITGFLALQSG